METFHKLFNTKFFVLNMSNIRDIIYTVFTSKERCKPDFSLSKQKLCHRITEAGLVIRECCRKRTFYFAKIESNYGFRRKNVKLRDLFLFYLFSGITLTILKILSS